MDGKRQAYHMAKWSLFIKFVYETFGKAKYMQNKLSGIAHTRAESSLAISLTYLLHQSSLSCFDQQTRAAV